VCHGIRTLSGTQCVRTFTRLSNLEGDLDSLEMSKPETTLIRQAKCKAE
jgi:hypothetical protein